MQIRLIINQHRNRSIYTRMMLSIVTLLEHFVLEECLALTKKEAHLYMFTDINRFLYWKEAAEKLGWYVWNKPFIWFRGINSGIAPRPNHGPRNTYEAIMYCIKGDKKSKVTNAVDVLNIPHERGN